jgi:pimeloyl-ACP methyl ester carboxylesterase
MGLSTKKEFDIHMDDPTKTQGPQLSASFRTTFQEHCFDVNDVRFHYVRGGTGPALILLHGWPQTWYEWHSIMPALAQHYTVIAPDLPGLGDSSVSASGYEKRTVAEELYQLVHALNFPEISLVGHDIGGMVAYAYASVHPTEVRRLAILEAPIPGDFFYHLPLLSPNSPTGEAMGWHFALHAVPDLPEALVTDHVPVYLSWFYDHHSLNPAAISQAHREEYERHYTVPSSLHAGFEYYRAFPQDIEQNKLSAQCPLPMPVLAMGGDHGAGDLSATLLKRLALHLQSDLVPQSGHWVIEENPDYVTQRLLTFLQ